MAIRTLLTAQASVAAGSVVVSQADWVTPCSLHAKLNGAGATATVKVWVSNDETLALGSKWVLAYSWDLASATPSNGGDIPARWRSMYAEVSAIAGGGNVDVIAASKGD